ncbi:MAG: hypothetical protein ACE5O2_01105 [Armatimonadota bacterium]
MPAWTKGGGKDEDVIVLSRVCVSRNVEGLFFPDKADEGTRESVLEIADRAIGRVNEQGEELLVYRLSEMGELDALALCEVCWSSSEAVGRPGAAVAATRDRSLCIFVNEQDHFRFQCVMPGLALREAHDRVEALPATFGRETRFARKDGLGYLTARPENAGTGLKACLMVDLPALRCLGHLEDVVEQLEDSGMIVRFTSSDEASEAAGPAEVCTADGRDVDAAEVVAEVEAAGTRLVEAERESREVLRTERKLEAADLVWRAHALLRSARLMSRTEALAHISMLRLGVALGIVRGLDASALNHLTVLVGSAYIQAKTGNRLDAEGLNQARAAIVRRALGAK